MNNKKSISLHRYECVCGSNFKIENENGDNGILFCPYCGIKRNDMGDDAFDGEFNYSVVEEL